MSKSVHNDVLDAALNEIATGNILTACNAIPTTRTEAVTTFALADIALTPGDGNGDFTVGDGDTDGRKVAMAAQNSVLIDTTGIANHAALCDGSDLLLVTECGDTQDSDTAQAGASTTITLASGASAVDDAYNGYAVKITGGTGAGQTRIISDYNGTTKVATVSAAWGTNPDATSTYEVFGIALTANASNTVNFATFDDEIADPV